MNELQQFQIYSHKHETPYVLQIYTGKLLFWTIYFTNNLIQIKYIEASLIWN